MSFKLGKRSLSNLEGVHPDLVKVVNRAIELTQVDFTVIEGLRTKERQAQLLKEKKTTTAKAPARPTHWRAKPAKRLSTAARKCKRWWRSCRASTTARARSQTSSA